MGTYKYLQIISKLLGIEFSNLDINTSSCEFIIKDEKLVIPFSMIKSIASTVSEEIENERSNGKFESFYDFMIRCYGKSVNKKTIESLIYAGCFDDFGFNRKTLLMNLDMLLNYGEIGDILADEESLKPVLQEYNEFSKKELLLNELSVFGFYLSSHPIIDYKIKYPNTVLLSDLGTYFDKNIDVIVYVDKTKEISTKKNDKMLFITGSDELNTVDIVLFPKIYEKYSDINIGDIIRIKGKVEKRFDKLQIVVNDITTLD